MFNETLLAGTLSVQAESGQTKNGKLLAHARIETTDILDDGRVFKTWVPIVAFSKAAERLLTFDHGDLLIARGRIAWSADQGGLVVACRDISRFALAADWRNLTMPRKAHVTSCRLCTTGATTYGIATLPGPRIARASITLIRCGVWSSTAIYARVRTMQLRCVHAASIFATLRARGRGLITMPSRQNAWNQLFDKRRRRSKGSLEELARQLWYDIAVANAGTRGAMNRPTLRK